MADNAETLPEDTYKFFIDSKTGETVHLQPASEKARKLFEAFQQAIEANSLLHLRREKALQDQDRTREQVIAEDGQETLQRYGYGHAFNGEANAVENVLNVFDDLMRDVVRDMRDEGRGDG